MTILAANHAEGGTNAVAVTTGNSGGASGTAFSGVTGTWTFSNVQEYEGALSYRSAQVGGTAQALQITLGAAITGTGGYQVAQWLTAFPASSFIVLKGLTAGFGGAWRVDITAAGLIRIRNSAGTQVAESVVAVTTATWWRFVVTVVQSTTVGSVTVDAYSGYASTPTITLTATGINTATETTNVQFGNSLSTPTLGVTYYDSLVIADAAIADVAVQDTSRGGSWAGSADEIASPVTIQDASGGSSTGSSTDVVLTGTSIGDGSGGAGAGGSTGAVAAGVALVDTSGGSSAGGASETVVTGTTVQDASGGAGLGRSADVVAAVVLIADGSGGASVGRSADAQASGVTVQDGSSGGVSAGGSTGTVQAGTTVQDASGGAGAGGAGAATLTLGVAIQDPSGGGSWAGSPDTATGSQVIQDSSGGSGFGASPETVAVPTVITDGSGGAGAGGSAGAAAAGVVVADRSGGGSWAGSAGALAAVVIITDTSGGFTAGGSSWSLAQDVTVTDSSGGGSFGRSTDLVAAGAGVTISDTSGGSSAGASTQTVGQTTVVRDLMVMPILMSALACLETEAAKVQDPPALYVVRPGDSYESQADPWVDECCLGVGWVRMVSQYETREFPEPATTPSNCPPDHWAIVVEVGISRCVPIMGGRNGEVVTREQWIAAAQAQADDGAALRRVLCCMRELLENSNVTAGQVNPLPITGGCGGISMQLTAQANACDCY